MIELPPLPGEDDPIETAGTGVYVDQESDTYTPPGRFRAIVSKVVIRPRTLVDAIRWLRAQITTPTQSWKGLCQSSVRQAYDLPAWATSAKQACEKTPKKYLHKTPLAKAPRGSIGYYRIGTNWHAVVMTGIRTHDKCLSVDYMRQGKIDYTPRDFARWGRPEFVGWSDWTPYGRIKLG